MSGHQTKWTGFADYVESFGSSPTGKGNNANFEAMLEAALEAESQSFSTSTMAVEDRQEAVEEEYLHDLPLKLDLECLLSCSENDALFSKKSRSEAPPVEERVPLHYRLTCGLVIKTRQADIRMTAKGMIVIEKIDFRERNEQTMSVFHTQIRNLCCINDRKFLEKHYSAESLWDTAVELVAKRVCLTKELCGILELQMLPVRDTKSGLLAFDAGFIDHLHAFFSTLKKPLASADPADVQSIAYNSSVMDSLLGLDRERCEGCSVYRALYCADCNGLRTPEASKALPPRIIRSELPYDVLLIIHFQETPHRSTGTQALALVEEDTVQVAHWPRNKDSDAMQAIIDSLDPARDLLLFPDDSAVCISDHEQRRQEQGDPLTPPTRARLVALEGSWTYAKKMAAYLKRRVRGLRSVCLDDNVVGTYWRFQTVGVSALSTIEALYYAFSQAQAHARVQESREHGEGEGEGEGEGDALWRLLLLFEYQRRKMVANGTRTARGLNPTGDGPLFDWEPYLKERAARKGL